MILVVMCAHAASIINGELAIRRKRNHFSAKELCSKEMSKIIVLLHAKTGCDVTSRFFDVGKKNCVDTSPEKYRSSNAFEKPLA